jgi:hypothetical protein
MSDVETMPVRNRRGAIETREIRQTLDIRDFYDTAAYPMLLIAANRHLSVGDLWNYLGEVIDDYPKLERSRSWVQRRRWWCQPPEYSNPINRPNADGKDAKALAIMAAHPGLSLRKLVMLLREQGVRRDKSWVCRYRGMIVRPPPI